MKIFIAAACSAVAQMPFPASPEMDPNITPDLTPYEPVGGPAPKNVPLPFNTAQCFVDATWDEKEVQTTKDIQYGGAYNKYTQKNETLMMDIYSPPASDARKARPAVVLMHGGAFLSGGKTDGDVVSEAKLLAARGYVVASITYRLIPIQDFSVLLTPTPAAVAQEDARAAVRYLRKNAGDLRIDSDRMAIGGSSAGALTAMYYAYVSNCTEGESGNPGYSSAVNTAISLSGSMKDQAFCLGINSKTYEPYGCVVNGADLAGEIAKGDIPTVEMHGTADNVIPYLNALTVHTDAQKAGVNNLLITIPKAGHVPTGDVFDPSKEFLNQWLTFASGALNLGQAECPSSAFVV